MINRPVRAMGLFGSTDVPARDDLDGFINAGYCVATRDGGGHEAGAQLRRAREKDE